MEIGHRYLIEGDKDYRKRKTILEVKVLEISPGEKYIKLAYAPFTGEKFISDDWSNPANLIVLQELPEEGK